MKTFDLIAFEAISGHTMDKVNQDRNYFGVYRVIPKAFTVFETIKKSLLSMLQKLGVRVRHDAEQS